MDTSVIYINQLPISERRGEPCATSLHGSTVDYKPHPCGSGSESQFRQMISQQVGQLLFNSPLSVCCGQIQNDTIVEENKEHDVRKRVHRKHRRHHSMRENKRKHNRASYSPSEHVTGTCQSGTRKTFYSKSTNEEIHDKHTVCLDDNSLSRVHPQNETICKNLGERTPCDGQ